MKTGRQQTARSRSLAPKQESQAVTVVPENQTTGKRRKRNLFANVVAAIAAKSYILERTIHREFGMGREVDQALRRLVEMNIITRVPVEHWGCVYRIAGLGAATFAAGARIQEAA
jgi:hypothetical protein